MRISFDGRTWGINQSVVSGNFNLIVISNLIYVLGGGRLYFPDRDQPSPSQFIPVHQELLLNPGGSSLLFTNLLADTNGFFAQTSGKTIFSRDGKAWRARGPSDPPVPTNEFAFASPPFARFASGRFEFSQTGTDWTPLPSPPIRSSSQNRLRKAVAIGDTVVAVDSFNFWVLTNQANAQTWVRLMANIGPEFLLEGSPEYIPGSYPWITSLEVGAGIVAATTTWGELLLSRDGRSWQTNQVGFAATLTDSAITPRGIMIVNLRTIAEALFDAAAEIPTQFGFTVETPALQFNGAMARFEIQTRPNLDVPWQTFTTTSTDQSIPVPNTGAAFFRAIIPP